MSQSYARGTVVQGPAGTSITAWQGALTGTVDGANLEFTFPFTPLANSQIVLVGGAMQIPGEGQSYTISGPTVTFSEAPPEGTTVYGYALQAS